MKFRVTRASDYLDNKPCEEAKTEEVKRKGVLGKEDYFETIFTLEINSLDELMAFVKKYDDIIIYNNPLPELCIYDGYVE